MLNQLNKIKKDMKKKKLLMMQNKKVLRNQLRKMNKNIIDIF